MAQSESRALADKVLAQVPRGLYIGGQWRESSATFAVRNPATDEVLVEIADAGRAEAQSAIDAAAEAQSDWAATDPRYRSELLRNVFDLLQERAEEFATIITSEMGKPLAESRGEVAYGSEFFRWFAEQAVQPSGRYFRAPSGGSRIMTMRQPVGPVYAITPWNFPLAMAPRKIGPALAAGCTVVLKPARATPLTMQALMGLFDEVGIPAGVVNSVSTTHSAEVSAPIFADPRLRKLTFTGSTPVGKQLLGQAANHVLRTSMELGGNAPFIVLASADLDKAVDGAVEAKMRNTGEACTAANRFLVHESLVAEFSARLGERMGQMVVGNGLDADTQVGPLIDAAAVQKVTAMLDDAVGRGARVVTGGSAIEGAGNFVQPTVLTGVDPAAEVMQDEIFGPVAPITAFSTFDEGLHLANATEFGLVAYVFGEELGETLRFAEGLETGMVGVNEGVVSNPAAPFGGVKASGLGREGGEEGIAEYLETKYIGLRV